MASFVFVYLSLSNFLENVDKYKCNIMMFFLLTHFLFNILRINVRKQFPCLFIEVGLY